MTRAVRHMHLSMAWRYDGRNEIEHLCSKMRVSVCLKSKTDIPFKSGTHQPPHHDPHSKGPLKKKKTIRNFFLSFFLLHSKMNNANNNVPVSPPCWLEVRLYGLRPRRSVNERRKTETKSNNLGCGALRRMPHGEDRND